MGKSPCVSIRHIFFIWLANEIHETVKHILYTIGDLIHKYKLYIRICNPHSTHFAFKTKIEDESRNKKSVFSFVSSLWFWLSGYIASYIIWYHKVVNFIFLQLFYSLSNSPGNNRYTVSGSKYSNQIAFKNACVCRCCCCFFFFSFSIFSSSCSWIDLVRIHSTVLCVTCCLYYYYYYLYWNNTTIQIAWTK